MPNWCDNVIMIKGSKEEILKLKDDLIEEDNVFSFNKILQCPEALHQRTAPERNTQKAAFNTKKYGAKDWYEWSVENWGTKWNSADACLVVEEEYDDGTMTIGYNLQTAWSPPLPLWNVLAEQHPNTNIYVCFDESGMDFSGWRYYENGELSREEDFGESYSNIRTFMEPDTGIWDYI